MPKATCPYCHQAFISSKNDFFKGAVDGAMFIINVPLLGSIFGSVVKKILDILHTDTLGRAIERYKCPSCKREFIQCPQCGRFLKMLYIVNYGGFRITKKCVRKGQKCFFCRNVFNKPKYEPRF